MAQWALALTLAWLASTIILTASVPLFRFLGRRGSLAIERLMGMLLVMIAVQMFLVASRFTWVIDRVPKWLLILQNRVRC